jgi:hypothetical protein
MAKKQGVTVSQDQYGSRELHMPPGDREEKVELLREYRAFPPWTYPTSTSDLITSSRTLLPARRNSVHP